KGTLLLVDAHFDPLRRTGAAAEKDPTRHKNMEGRTQTSNAAFSFRSTYPFKECLEGPGEPFSEYCTQVKALKGVKEFTDAKTWYPGLEVQDGGLYYRDFDASTVIPAKDDQPYSTRVVNVDGTPATELYGLDIGDGHVLGSGDPGDEGKALGVRIKLVAPLPGILVAIVQVTPPKKCPAPHPDLRTAVTRGRPEPAPAAPTIVDHERTAHQSRAHSGDPEGSARGSGDQHSLAA